MNTNAPAPTGHWRADDDAIDRDGALPDRDLLFGRLAVLNGFVDDKAV